MLLNPLPLIKDIRVSEIAFLESTPSRDSLLCGEETWLTSSDISLLKLLTSLSRILTRRSSTLIILRRTRTNSSLETWLPVEPLELLPSCSSILLTSLELDLLQM